ncbi:MAG TPA: hypothetical protein VGD52_04475 [Pseudoduganella sp.]
MTHSLSRNNWFMLLFVATLAGHLTLYRMQGNPLGHPEWPLLLDLLVTFPVAYLLICRPAWKDWLKKSASMLMLGLAFGSLAIPDADKLVWREIDRLRVAPPVLFAIAEITLAAWLLLGVRRALLADANSDRVLARAIQRRFGKGVTGRLMEFEARVWYYGLFMRKLPVFEGEQHFSTAHAGGNASNQLAWVWLMVFDIPIAHMLLHFLWSPFAAWVATALTAWGLLYLLADYRATLVRPVSLAADALHVRCGALASDAVVPYAAIAAVACVPHPERRLPGKRYFRHQGVMNVEITLRPGTALPTLVGSDKAASHLVLGVDEPAQFVEALAARLH